MLSLSGIRDEQWMVGVDFGSSSLKAVLLKGQKEHMQLAAMACVPTPANSIVDHQLQEIDAVSEALKQLKRQLGSRIDRVATAVTGSSVTTKIISLPRGMTDEDLENQVMLEAGEHIPFPLDEISLDFERLGPNRARPDHEHILLSAARTDSISTRLEALQMAGWEASVVDIGVHAIARSAQALLRAEQAEVGLLALADIGAECLTFGVVERGEVIHSRLQNFGGAHFTRELSQLSGIAESEANPANLLLSLPEPLLEEAKQHHITAILQHIRRNLQIFQGSAGSQLPRALFLSGGGSQLAQLASVLEHELAMPVFVPRLERLLGGDERQYSDGAAYSTALGLALRSFTPCPI